MSADALKIVAEIEDRLWQAAVQVAQHLGVAKDTIYRWRENKGSPAHTIGRLWKFKVTEVDDWVRSGGARDEDARKRDGS